MGNVCAPSFSCDDTIARCLDCTVSKAGYICQLQDNLDALNEELKKLIEEKNDVWIRVVLAERQQMKRLEQVQGWLSRVEDVKNEVDKLDRERPQQVEELCLGGFCSNSCKSSYKFGEKVVKALRKVQRLRKEGQFKDVAQPIPERPGDEIQVPTTTVGLDDTLDRVWRCLNEEQVGIVGLYGMGGVGKTTLLAQINNKFLETLNNFDFDYVIWEVVSRDLQLEKIQDSIAKKIGLDKEPWKTESLEEKAQKIFNFLNNKKFVVLLDDIWESIDLVKLGLPVPSRASESKVVFTTRKSGVCGQMDAHKSFKVDCLRFEDAWRLFEEKVGRDALDSHPDIPELAETVAKECGGLPLALITVGRAMASRRTPQEWEQTIDELRSPTTDFTSMEKWVFSLLKLSYDFLPSDETRFCLLYCSLFPEDHIISIEEDLIDCWICEEFLDEYDGIRARNQGHSVIRYLIRSCLLEEVEDNYVKMHDVVRDMALWIAATTDRENEKFLVLAGVGLTEAPKLELWKEVTRMSLTQNKIRRLLESPVSPHLVTLFLDSNYSLREIDGDFFRSMGALRVLKLSYNNSLVDLSGISRLLSLQHLDLSWTFIEELPIELKSLVKLKCLNLECTFSLSRILPQVISNLKMLRTLRLFHCGLSVRQEEDSILFGDGDILVDELLGLEHLNILTITFNSLRGLQRLLSSPRLQDIRIPYFCLRHCHNSKSLGVFSLASLRHLQKLRIQSNDLEELKIDYTEEVRRFRGSDGFPHLRRVDIISSKLRHVTWLILAPNLKCLLISYCQFLEEIISDEKLGEVPAEVMGNLIPFARLESLLLLDLPNLKGIHSRALPFPYLKEIEVHSCPNLKQLPFDSNSALECKITIKGEQDWWNELQWDNEATKNIFLPCFKPFEVDY